MTFILFLGTFCLNGVLCVMMGVLTIQFFLEAASCTHHGSALYRVRAGAAGWRGDVARRRRQRGRASCSLPLCRASLSARRSTPTSPAHSPPPQATGVAGWIVSALAFYIGVSVLFQEMYNRGESSGWGRWAAVPLCCCCAAGSLCQSMRRQRRTRPAHLDRPCPSLPSTLTQRSCPCSPWVRSGTVGARVGAGWWAGGGSGGAGGGAPPPC